MKKTIVIFDSKYGSTKRYAQWIAEELGADLTARKDADPGSLGSYDVIVYGGGLYAGGVSGISFITKNFEQIKDKKILLFTCGLGDPNVPENVENIRKGLDKALPDEMRDVIEIFHLRGGMDYSKLSLLHRSMMSMVRKAVEKKDPATRTQEDIQMLETFGKSVDFTDRGTIKPLIQKALEE